MEQPNTTHTQRRPSNLTGAADHDEISLTDIVVDSFSRYAKERPESLALWAFGIGFVLGWKLKPW